MSKATRRGTGNWSAYHGYPLTESVKTLTAIVFVRRSFHKKSLHLQEHLNLSGSLVGASTSIKRIFVFLHDPVRNRARIAIKGSYRGEITENRGQTTQCVSSSVFTQYGKSALPEQYLQKQPGFQAQLTATNLLN